MNYPHRGYALLINHFEFNSKLNLNNRNGSEVDLKRLQETLANLGFEIQVHQDKTVAGIKKIIKNVAQKTDHSDCDCLLVVVSTHGKAYGELYAKDNLYSVQELWDPFIECPSLIGKPKIFFIQACRGKKLDSGLILSNSINECVAYTSPSSPDFLIVYSSVEGYGSFRNTNTGTWFIQSLCEKLETLTPDTDILTIMTRTIQRVASTCMTSHFDKHGIRFKTQVPHINCTLVKNIYFRPKITTRDKNYLNITKEEKNEKEKSGNEEEQHTEENKKKCEERISSNNNTAQ
ncbi:hypothetical protein L9F63_005323 [Diploptera punctata]|uniref:Uncharacterized protein n=1 Tax=Diploptera punctata TaxID=6984 RepID=A0AAD7ZEG4_DIPPU|nr:hypothetical protein L9F63_005323 [Diploptera punctata]